MTSVVSQKVYGLNCSLVAGTFTLANVNSVAPFGESSRILSIRRVASAGTEGTAVVAYKVVPTGAGAGAVWGLTVNSQNALDTSTYLVQWSNSYIQSQLLSASGAGVGAEFAP